MDHLFGFFKSEACDQTIEYMYGQFLQRQYRDFSDTNSTPVTVYAELFNGCRRAPQRKEDICVFTGNSPSKFHASGNFAEIERKNAPGCGAISTVDWL